MTTLTINEEAIMQEIAETIELNDLGKKHTKLAYRNWTIAVIRVAKALGYELRKIEK